MDFAGISLDEAIEFIEDNMHFVKSEERRKYFYNALNTLSLYKMNHLEEVVEKMLEIIQGEMIKQDINPNEHIRESANPIDLKWKDYLYKGVKDE